MGLEPIVILSFALLYALWGLLLVSHSLLQFRKKPYKRNLIENKATEIASAEVNDINKVA
jgi:hypothetical protein